MKIQKWPREKWPEKLTQIPRPPEEMWITGNWPDENLKFLTVVGTRKYTDYGREIVFKLISELENFPIVIVSGLALGIDALAHETALQFKLKTIAVPGSGLDPKFIYPKTNFYLAEKILEQKGCLVSPFSPKTYATPWMFIQRNSILAGLSDATLIIECEEKSGSLITARFALEFNRQIGAVPGSILNKTSAGPNRILKEGAVLISSGQDILDLLEIKVEKDFFEEKELVFLSEKERFILSFLDKPREIEEMKKISFLDIKEINETIALLEIRGLIRQEFGRIICQKKFRKQ